MLTRRTFLASSAGLLGLATLPRARGLAASTTPCNLILVTAFGGWDVTYALDPKLGASGVDGPEVDEVASNPDDRESIRRFGDVPVVVNPIKRPQVTRYFERWAPRSTVINGVQVGNISHSECQVRMLTGRLDATRPDLAAIAGADLGAASPVPYLDLGGTGLLGELAASSGRTGISNQIKQLLDRRTRLEGPAGSGLIYPQYTPTEVEGEAVAAWLARRESSWAEATVHGRGRARVDAWGEATARARALADQGRSLASQLTRGSVRTLSQQASLAADLLEAGLAHTVSIDSGLSWDTHTDNDAQHGMHDQLFAALDGLATDLDDRGMLDTTLVCVFSEMTRTPKRNAAQGKDHWPVTSALLLGGPTAGRRVLGATTNGLDARGVDLATGAPDDAGPVLRYDHLMAGVLSALDVDPGPWLPGVEALGGLV